MTLAALMMPDAGAGPFAMHGGVRPTYQGTGLQVTQDTTADMNVLVGTGTAFVPAAITTNAGWACHNNGTVSRALQAASAANPRIDVVIAHVYDATDDVGPGNNWALEVVTGTPAVTPQVPALPTNALELAQVAVAKNATAITNANITDVRPQTVALGGVLPCTSASMPATPYVGQCVYQADTGFVVVWNGSTWRNVSSGTQTLYLTAPQPITSTSSQTITSLQGPVTPGTYSVRGVITWVQGSTGSQQNFWFNGPGASLVEVPYFFALDGSGVSNGVGVATKIGSAAGASMPSPPFAGGTTITLYFDGIITFTAAGTFGLSASEQTSGDSFTISTGSVMTLRPV